jgi:hypothetical protein
MNPKIKSLLTSHGDILQEYVDYIKLQVCDVRNPLKVKAEHEKEVRIAVADVIDTFFTEKIATFNGKKEPNSDNWK